MSHSLPSARRRHLRSCAMRAIVAFAVTVAGLLDVAPFAVHQGAEHPAPVRAAALEPGQVWAWGINSNGEMGDGTTDDRSTPGQVAGVGDALAVSAGRGHALAVKADGTVWSWGYNGYGQVGNGTVGLTALPGPVTGLTGATAVAAGEYHSLALKADGTVAAWGSGAAGALGAGGSPGAIPNASTPVAVRNLTGATAVAAGDEHSLALRSDGTVWTWGDNSYGQLGDGTQAGRSVPAIVPGLTNVRAIAARSTHSLALKNDGTVWAWGFNLNGVLGDGTIVNRSTPVRVVGLDRIVGISAGGEHNLAVRADGTVWAWGTNAAGGLGDGTTEQRKEPVQALGLTDVFIVSAGSYESYALKGDWTVWAWGRGGSGQLGNGSTDSRPTPGAVGGLNNVSAIAGGNAFALAITPARPLTVSITRRIPPGGAQVTVDGGTAQRGGAALTFPAGALAGEAEVTFTSRYGAPAVLTPPGGATLVPRTLEVTGSGPLSKTAEIAVSLTPAELAGRDLAKLTGAVVVGDSLESRPTRVLNAATGTVAITVDHFSKFTLFEAKVTPPVIQAPAPDATLTGFGTRLTWTNSPGVTQYHLQVVPFNGDGPAINLIRDVADTFDVPAPPDWYGLLPDITYFWRVRTATVPTSATEADWSAWSTTAFRTPKAGSATITVVAPPADSTVAGLTPQLQWANSQAGVFYYEVQLSKDKDFVTDPARATSMVYGALIHGGVTTPANSYSVPAGFPLEAATAYYWRVRPRIQGDGTPAAWSAVFTFKTG